MKEEGTIPEAVRAALAFGDKHPEILQLSLEQLRMLFLLNHFKSISKIAKHTGKEQTSVTKTIQAAENKFIRVAKEEIVNRSLGRNRFELIQPLGNKIVAFSESLLEQAYKIVDDINIATGPVTLRIGLVSFQMSMFADIKRKFVLEAEKRRIPYLLELKHTHTSEMRSFLNDDVVDIVLGGDVCEIDENPMHEDKQLDFIAHHEEKLGLLGRLDLKRKSITFQDIISEKMPVLLPNKGAIYHFITNETGLHSPESIKKSFNLIDWSNDVNMMIEMLRHSIYEASIISTSSIYETLRQQEEFKDTFFYHLENTKHVMKYGVFIKREERYKYSQNHPLTIFLNCC